ncbi:RDD family protein [Timonella sp. A28]|uniref:RDD family protein n=1 Tax=Timonella sp. A28 TaxID=3442640 RepID=UPI003EBEB4F6
MNDHYVIGEGVILDARAVSFMTRGFAFAIDAAVAIILLIAFTLFPASTSTFDSFGPAAVIATIVTIWVLIPTAVETLSRGRSLGKLAMGVQVVRDDGGPISVRHAFIRSLVGVGELWMTVGAVALITSLLNNRGKRLGDIMAGTYVVRVRTKKHKEAPFLVAPALQQWSMQADIGKAPDGLALSARQFLSRRSSLHPASRAQKAQEFSAELERFVAPLPPFAAHPEDFITAVLVERSRREIQIEDERSRRARSLQSRLDQFPFGISNPDK